MASYQPMDYPLKVGNVALTVRLRTRNDFAVRWVPGHRRPEILRLHWQFWAGAGDLELPR